MAESSSELSAEEMTEALSLEEKTKALFSPVGSASSDSGPVEEASLQDNPGEITSSEDNSDQADSTENSNEANIPEEANDRPPCKFREKDLDPVDLVPYIEKYMSVQLENNYSYVGFIHSIDPLTYSVILSVPKADGIYQTVIIPGTSVMDITEAPCDSSIIPPKRKKVNELPKSDLQIKQSKVISWLKENCIPVAEDGEKIVFGGVILLPPYGEKDICTTNPLIAIEIKNIIVRMPADYQPK